MYDLIKNGMEIGITVQRQVSRDSSRFTHSLTHPSLLCRCSRRGKATVLALCFSLTDSFLHCVRLSSEETQTHWGKNKCFFQWELSIFHSTLWDHLSVSNQWFIAAGAAEWLEQVCLDGFLWSLGNRLGDNMIGSVHVAAMLTEKIQTTPNKIQPKKKNENKKPVTANHISTNTPLAVMFLYNYLTNTTTNNKDGTRYDWHFSHSGQD